MLLFILPENATVPSSGTFRAKVVRASLDLPRQDISHPYGRVVGPCVNKDKGFGRDADRGRGG